MIHDVEWDCVRFWSSNFDIADGGGGSLTTFLFSCFYFSIYDDFCFPSSPLRSLRLQYPSGFSDLCDFKRLIPIACVSPTTFFYFFRFH